MRLELWLHVPTGDRHVVMLTDASVQQAYGPLSNQDMRAVQHNTNNIRWSKQLATWIAIHAAEFVAVWPTPADCRRYTGCAGD